MPIEIRELVIRAAVNSDESRLELNEDRVQVANQLTPEARAVLVEACAAQVIELLRQRSER